MHRQLRSAPAAAALGYSQRLVGLASDCFVFGLIIVKKIINIHLGLGIVNVHRFCHRCFILHDIINLETPFS